MRVKIFDLDDSRLTYRTECDLAECFPEDPEGFVAAYVALANGQQWALGGGAAPIVILERATLAKAT